MEDLTRHPLNNGYTSHTMQRNGYTHGGGIHNGSRQYQMVQTAIINKVTITD